MLLPEMTPGTERSILASLAWMQAMGAQGFQPVQLLLGLLHEDEGKPAALLQQQGIQRSHALTQFQIASSEIAPDSELPAVIDPGLEKLLYDARLMAIRQEGSPVVHSEHLLLALLENSEALRTELSKIGYDHEQMRKQLGTAPQPSITMDEPLKLVDSVESVSLARIIDANANRAREALRVLEELARFHLNDAYLTKSAKEIRHELTQALANHLPREVLLRSRETERDVGTGIRTESETFRPTLRAVLRVNAHRLQEALRSLEEYGKVLSEELGRAIEKLRYRTYTLERALFIGERARDVLAKAQLYLLVSKGSCAASIEWTIEEAAAGGVSIVQLREKNKTDRELLKIAHEVRAVTRKLGILFIMNDRPDVARLSYADGVHLGQDDLDVMTTRNIVGTEAIIGVSTHNKKQLEQAILDGADYVGIGPTFASKTKNFDELAGLEFVRQAAAMTTLPAFAIGGIDASNVGEVVEAGLKRIAVGQAIAQAEEPRQTAGQLMAALQR